MKNKLFIVLCCLIWVWQICQAQVSGNGSQEECNLSVFQEFLDIPDLAIAKGKLMNDGENLLLFSGIDQGIGLTNITKAGTPNWTKSYKFSENTFPSDLIKATDGSLWAVANASTTSALSYLLKLTTGGDIIWAKELESPGISIEKLIEIGGNSFFAVGSREEPGSSKMGVVMKIDNQGEVEWARDYNIDPNTSEDTGFSNIIAVGPNRWVIGGRTGFSFFTTQTTQLICINDAGDIVWEKSHNAEVKFISAMKLSSANTIQVFYSQGVLNDTNLVLSEFDLDGNTLRSIVVSNDSRLSTSHFVELPNTDLLCFGSRINNPFFFTLDSDWNLLASKEYDAGYGPSFTGNTFLVEGENIFFAAERYENAPRGGFLAKTNLDFELDDCLTSEIDLAINTFNFNELSSELESNSFNVLVEDEDPVLQLVDMTSFDICRIASDSIVTQDSLELCDGDSIIIGGMTYFNNTIVEQVFTTDNGCDSTHRTTLFFFPNVETFQTITIEEGDNAIVFGSLVTQAGVFEETYVASNGCDSTHQITVDVLPSSSGCEEILLTAIGAEGEDMYLDNIVANDGSVWVIFSDGIASWLNWGVAKLSKEGEVLWIKNYQFDGRQRFNVLLPTYDGGLVVLGDLSRQSYMFKLDSDGDFLWGNRIDYLDFAEGYDLIETEDNDILMIGEGFETVTSDRHGLVMKLTEDGEIMWSKRIAYNGPQISFGLRLASIERAFNGNYIVTGQFRFTPVVLEMTGEGEVVWLRRYEINNNIGSPIKLSRNGTGDGYFFSPINFSFFDNSTAFIGEIALNGDLKNLRSFTTPNLKSVTNLQLSPNGNLLVNLSTDADNFGKIVLELDSDLKEVKNRTLGDEGSPSSISLAVDQNYVFQATDAQVDGEQGFLFSRSTRLLNIACGNNSVTFDKEYLTAVDTIPLTTYEIIDQFYDSDYSVEEEDYEGVVELQCSELENEIFTSETQFFCEGTSAIIFGQVVEENGIFSETNAIDLGCDSTHQITAIFQNAQSTSETLTYTEGDTAVIFGVTVTSDGIFDDTSTGSNGCDSTHTITVVFTPDVNPCSAVFTSEQIETCSGDSLLIFGDWIFADGIYSSLEVSSQGCDSTHQITTIFTPTTSTSETLTYTEGDTAVIFGVTVTSDGIFDDTSTGSNGCDSTHTITVVFTPDVNPCTAVFTSEQIETCSGDSLLIFGDWIFVDGIYSSLEVSSQGCDSTHQITTIFTPTTSTSETLTYTEGETAVIFGVTVTSDGIFDDTSTGSNGCDSTHTITVVFTPDVNPCTAVFTSEQIETCSGDSLLIFGDWIFADGIYSSLEVSSQGCDSTHQITTIFIQPIYEQENLQFCAGDTVVINGQTITSNQIVETEFIGSNGCDSILQSFIEFKTEIETNEVLTFCQGEIANINGIVYSENAIAFNTAMSSQGCDSTHITTLIFQPAALTTDTIVACVGDTVILPNEIIIGLFPLTENLVRNEVGVNGCDSTHLINLTFEESFYSLDTIYFCEGETASIFGNQYFESAFVEEESVNIAGCDSTNAMQIIFTPNIFTEEYIELCQGESVMVFGNEISENQILTEVFPSANGCDSIHQVEVVFANTFESYQNETICAEDFLLFFGDTIQDAGTYTQELTPLGAGCDSMVILTVDIAQEITAELISNLEVESGIPFNLPLLNLNANTSLIWSNAEFLSCSDCSNPVARVAADQEFSVLISNEFGCQKLLRVMVTVREKLDFYIPNVFSPNNDGINDGFTIFTNDQEAIIENLQIYDRWGAMIFETTDVPPNNVDLGWKGRHKGRPLNPAVFVYQATIRLNDGTKVFRAGDVVLLR